MKGIRNYKDSLLVSIVAAIISFACMPLVYSFAETVTYTYDAANRLKQAQYASGLTIAYDYDGMGNMTRRVVASTDSAPPSAPVIASPTNGGVVNASSVILSGTAEALSTVKVYNGATLLGGTTADATGGWVYTTTLLPDGNYNFTATATDAAGNASGSSTLVVLTIQTTAPTTTASPVGGTYNSAQSVALTCFDGAGSGCDKIYYTTDGSTPTPASSIYVGPIIITSTTTLNYFATDLAGHSEPVKSQTYTLETTPPVTTASPAGGAFNNTRVVTLTCMDGSGSGCARIYYTTDGTTPTTASSVYTAPITISATATLKYFAVDQAGNSEAVKSQAYIIETVPPVTTAGVAGGYYNSIQNVALTCSDGLGSGCDKIYYTTDGTTPTTASSVYTDPISITSTTTLKYFATDKAGNSESVQSQTYTIYITQCYWTNTAGGNWSAPTNWSCGHVPTSTDYAFITMSGTYAVTLDINATVNSLTLGGATGTQTLSATSKTLTINTASSVGSSGTLSFSSSTITGTGSITSSGVINLSSGTISNLESFSNSGTLNLSSSNVSGAGSIANSGMINMNTSTINSALVNGGTINAYGTSAIGGALTTQSGSLLNVESACGNASGQLTVATGFTNNGTIELSNSCISAYSTTLTVTSSTPLVNAPGGVINVLAGSNTGTRTLKATLDNQGTVTVGYSLLLNKPAAVNTNSGTINANATFTVNQSSGSFTNNGMISIASGMTVSMSNVSFTQGTGATITGPEGTLSLSYLTASLQAAVGVGTLALNNATVGITSGVNLGEMDLVLISSTINGSGVTITNSAGKTLSLRASTINTALVNGGTINAYGTSAIGGALTMPSGSLLKLNSTCSDASAQLTVANGFTNNGTIELTNSCTTWYNTTLTVTSSTPLVNAPGGVINAAVGSNTGYRYLKASLDNQGTVTVDYSLQLNKPSAVNTNSGTINANATFTVNQSSGSFTNNGVISIASGMTVSMSNVSFTQSAGATITGPEGTLSLSYLTASLQTAVGVGTLALNNATVGITSDINLGTQSLALVSSTVNGSGVTITNPAGKTLSLSASTINTALVNGGTINAYGTSAIGGALTTQSGSMLKLNSTCSDASSQLTIANGFTNNGTIELTNSCTTGYNTTLTVTLSTTLVNAPGGVINAAVGSNTGYRYLRASLDNQGAVTVGYPLTMDRASAVHTNSGIIAIDSGKTLSISNGTFTNASSGILSGSGTISFSSANFAQNGAINPGSSLGKLSITGTLPQTATSAVNMEIGGTTAGTNYDQLAVSGAATLSGTLNVNLVNGFTPNTGDSFTLMTYGSKTGAFSAVNLPSMGKIWDTTYNPTSVVLSVGEACPSIILSPSSLSVGTVGTAYSQAITATGGSGSYTYAMTSGSLPSGLTLSSGGVLSGTPTAAGTYAFTITGTDATTCTGSVQYTMTVQTPCVEPPSGLVSWWQGEGDANDQMSHNTGTLVNGTAFITGRVGQAFSFDGIDDAVQTGTSGLPVADGDRAMAVWVKITEPVATDAVFAGYGNPNINGQAYFVGAQGSGNTLFFSNGGDTLTGPNLQAGRWYHVAVTNSANLVTLYLDGAAVATGTVTLSTPASSTLFAGYIDADRKLKGALDEVQVFDRALSAGEIGAIFNAGSKGLCDTVAPTMLSTVPTSAAVDVAINAPITAVFSEAMDPTTLNGASFMVSGGVTGTVAYDAGTKAVTLTPSAGLAYSTTYTATITAGAKDLAGNALAADYSWSFTTMASPDTTPPTTTASPAGGTYASAQNVTLACNDGTGSGCETIFYTVDGTPPTTSSSAYNAPISIAADTTLQYFAVDKAGNSEMVKSQTYTIDMTAPAGSVSINNGATLTNSAGVALTLTCTDANGCSQMRFSNDNANWSPLEAYAPNKAWTLAATEGAETVYVMFDDGAGNWSTTYSASITLDTTAPTGSMVINSGAALTNSNGVALTLACTDANGCSLMQFSNDNATWSTAEAYATSKAWALAVGDGPKAVYVKYQDAAGIWSAAYSATIALDTTAPTTTASPAGGAYKTSQSVTLACSDGTGAGCSTIYYTTNGSIPTTASTVYSAAINIAANTNLQYFAVDLAGNSEGVKNQNYIIDGTAPTTTATPGTRAFSGTLIVALTCNDSTGVGCDKTYYTTNGTTPTTSSTVYTAPISITATTTLKFFSTDLLGNSEAAAVKTATYTLDTTLPTGTISINAAATYATSPSVTLTLTCTDTNGCSQMRFSNDNTTWSAAETYATSKAWTLATGDGTRTVYVKYQDAAGNWSTVYNDTIILDANAPTTTASPLGGVYNANKSVTLTCADGTGSGCNKIYYTTNGTTPTTASTAYSKAISITATTTLKYFATDKAGLSEAVKTQVYTIDKTAPTGSIVINAGAASTNNAVATLTFTCTDANGCSQMQFSNNNSTWSTAEAYATTKTWTMTTGTGTKTVYAKFKDTAGNWSTAYSDTISLAASSDLIVKAVSAPANANITEPVNVSVTIANQSGEAGNFGVNIYLSTDTAIATTDTLVGSITYAGTLATGAQATVNTTVRIPATLAAGTYYIGAIVDPPVTGYTSGYVVEINEANNALAGNAMTITATSPDLTVTTLSGPASGNVNEVVTASATVKNQGGNTGGFNVYLYLSTDAAIATTDTYLGYTTINSLATGAQSTVSVAGKVPSTTTAGNYYVGAIADPPVTGYPSGYVTESNEANNALAGNVMAVTTTAPDLTVVTASGPTGANITEPITVQALIKNQGGSAGGFYVSAYLSTDTAITTGDTLIGSFWYDSTLAAGGQTTVNIPASIPATVAGGNYYIGVIADPSATGYPSGYVTENDETNNALAGNSVTVAATRADLTVTAVSGPTTGTKGQPIAVSSTIKNQGGTTGAFSVGIYLSTDATITTGDTLIGYMPVTSLAGGASTAASGSYTIPATLAAGTYYIGAVADYSGAVVESLETNNALAGNQITVGP